MEGNGGVYTLSMPATRPLTGLKHTSIAQSNALELLMSAHFIHLNLEHSKVIWAHTFRNLCTLYAEDKILSEMVAIEIIERGLARVAIRIGCSDSEPLECLEGKADTVTMTMIYNAFTRSELIAVGRSVLGFLLLKFIEAGKKPSYTEILDIATICGFSEVKEFLERYPKTAEKVLDLLVWLMSKE